jgi:hypothetical protein
MDTENTELSATPRYKIVGKYWLGVLGIAHPPGSEFKTMGWPPAGELEALNEPARRILDFQKIHQFDAFKPDSPFDVKLGRYFLPEPGRDHRVESVRIVPADRVLSNMPSYRARRNIPDEQYAEPRRFPHRNIAKGDLIAVLTWPRMLWPADFEPANAEAEAVIAYFGEAGEHPYLLPSPWCHFHRAVFLPDLATVPRGYGSAERHAAVMAMPPPTEPLRGRPGGGARRPVAA